MDSKLNYILLGIAMFFHAIYMLITHQVSFGWDRFVFNDFRLYVIVIPYMIFAVYMVYCAIDKEI